MTDTSRASSTGQAKIFNALFGTTTDYSALIARLALGVVIFPHGAQKLLGWFGGPGFGATIAGLPVPSVLAFLLVVAEFFGALALVVGLLSRVAALGIACVMVGAVVMVHLRFGFFMNWSGQSQGEGIEYHILALALAVVVMIKGSGALSLDHRLSAGKS